MGHARRRHTPEQIIRKLREADRVKWLKELERENQTLKRIVADQLLENQALQEIARGNW